MASISANDSNSSEWMNNSVDKCGWTVVGGAEIVADMSSVKYLDLILYPILLFLCTFGNILNIAVLKRETSAASKNSYLTTIAVFDMIYMWSALLTYIGNYEFEINGSVGPSFRKSFDAAIGLFMFLQEVCVLSSAWMTVAFSAERFLAIVRPLQFLRRSGSPQQNIAIIVGIVTIAVIMASNRLADYYWVYVNYISIVPKPKFRTPKPEALTTWYSINIWSQAITQAATFFTILFLNTFILHELIRQRFIRKSDFRASTQPRDNIKTPLSMLGACVVVYLLTQAPLFIHNIFYLLEKLCVSQLNRILAPFITPIENLMINVYFSLNFVLYCGVSSKFRQKLATVLNLFRARLNPNSLPIVRKKASNSTTKETKLGGSTKTLA